MYLTLLRIAKPLMDAPSTFLPRLRAAQRPALCLRGRWRSRGRHSLFLRPTSRQPNTLDSFRFVPRNESSILSNPALPAPVLRGHIVSCCSATLLNSSPFIYYCHPDGAYSQRLKDLILCFPAPMAGLLHSQVSENFHCLLLGFGTSLLCQPSSFNKHQSNHHHPIRFDSFREKRIAPCPCFFPAKALSLHCGRVLWLIAWHRRQPSPGHSQRMDAIISYQFPLILIQI